ncbi:MAG: Na(+)/H(+) antiporter subunit B [Burkholderiaceae bacterium]|nr:MAG: Na(+)/H(+) antiporter subunit B [Burkholderiaceae bacterium]
MNSREVIIRTVSKKLIPLILLFALYVQFHGDFGPGGGFQAGAIFSAGFILYSLIFGFDKLVAVVSSRLLELISVTGVLLYIGVGFLCMILGGEFLNYSVLGDTQVAGQHIGILLVEFGVFLSVFSVLLLIFYCFASR